jgi:hypothetical protein
VYGCETWFIVRDQLCVFEGRVLRKIPGAVRKEVTGEWRKLLIEELNNLCPQNIRITKLKGKGGFVATVGEMTNGF